MEGYRPVVPGTLHVVDGITDDSIASCPARIQSDGLAGEYSAAVGGSEGKSDGLFTTAESHLENGRLQEAVDTANEALLDFKAQGALDSAAYAARLMVNAQRVQAELALAAPEDALQLAERELQDFKTRGHKTGEAAMTLSLAELKESEDLPLSGSGLQDAVSLAEKAKTLAEEAGNNKMMALALLALADLQLRPGLSEEAIQKAIESGEQGLNLCTSSGYQAGEARCLHTLSVAKAMGTQTGQTRFKDAVADAKEALQNFRDLSMPCSSASVLHTLALMHIQNKSFSAARDYAKQACDELQEVGAGSHLWRAATSKTLVLTHGLCGDAEKALLKAQQTLDFFQESAYDAGEAAANEMLAQAHLFLAGSTPEQAAEAEAEDDVEASAVQEMPIDRSLQAAQEAKRMYGSLGSRVNEAKIAIKLSQLHVSKEDYPRALADAQEAQSIAQGLASPLLEGVALQALIKAYHDNNDIKTALTKALECLTLYQDLGVQPHIGLAMLNCSMLHALLGELDEAVELAIKAQEAFKDSRAALHEVEALRLLVELHAFNKEPEKAVKYALRALNHIRDHGSGGDEVRMLLRLAQLYLDQEAAKLEEGLDGARYDSQAQRYVKEAAAVVASKMDGDTSLSGSVLHTRGYMHLTAGRLQDAVQAASRALEFFRVNKDLQGEANTWLLVAEIQFHNDKKEKAKDCADKALSAFKRLPGQAGREGEAQAGDLLKKCQQTWVLAGEGQVAMLPGPDGAGGIVAASSAGAEIVQKKLEPQAVKSMIQSIVSDVIGVDDVEGDAPLMDSGMDSLSSLDFRNKLKATFEGANLPASTVFDYPSVNAITNLILEEQ